MNYQEFIAGAKNILLEFNALTKDFGFLEDTTPDHICYKCSNKKEFEHIRAFFEEHGQFIYQAEISGRPIATIKFKEPLVCERGEVWYLELSDQKPDGSQTSRWDHMEVKHNTDDYGGLVQSAQDLGLDVVEKFRPHHTTHEVKLENGFKLVFTREMLGEKIKKEMGGVKVF